MQTNKYDDIIHLSRPKSAKHPPMSMQNRAAQFSPFAALVGYEAVLEETARLTDQETFLDEGGKELLDRKLCQIAGETQSEEILFLCFEPDPWKPGGHFVHVRGKVKKIDLYRRVVLLENGRELIIDQIRAIDGVEEKILQNEMEY